MAKTMIETRVDVITGKVTQVEVPDTRPDEPVVIPPKSELETLREEVTALKAELRLKGIIDVKMAIR
jgi:hypothetical protein